MSRTASPSTPHEPSTIQNTEKEALSTAEFRQGCLQPVKSECRGAPQEPSLTMTELPTVPHGLRTLVKPLVVSQTGEEATTPLPRGKASFHLLACCTEVQLGLVTLPVAAIGLPESLPAFPSIPMCHHGSDQQQKFRENKTGIAHVFHLGPRKHPKWLDGLCW